MNTSHTSEKPRGSRWNAVAAAAALFALAAAGITALELNAVHAIHPLAAAVMASPQGEAPAALLPAWQATASDASVPSATEVFTHQTTPGADDLPPTF